MREREHARRGRGTRSAKAATAFMYIRAVVIAVLILFFVVSVWATIWFIGSEERLTDKTDAEFNARLWLNGIAARSSKTNGDTSTAAKAGGAESTVPPRYESPPGEMDPWRNMKLPDDWYDCIRRNLQLDERGRPLHPVAHMQDAIPLLITPLTGDAVFFPYFICSIDVPVRYHLVILNERDPDAVAVVEELQRRFGDSGRLIVRRNRYNGGYSGSMNQGFEWALNERGDAEVPWVFACGIDVIFEKGVLSDLIALVKLATVNDAAMLTALREEVAMEERLILEGNTSYYDAWAPKGRPLKVLRSGFPGVPLNVHTARLLPDRIRHLIAQENRFDGRMPDSERRQRYFGKYTATVVPAPNALGTIAITRLALSVAGFFDENYFPAYMDDIDLRWRHFSLGFRARSASATHVGRYHHYNAANLRGGGFPTSLPQKFGTEANYSRIAFHQYLTRKGDLYDFLKYGKRDRKGVWHEGPESAVYTYTYFNVDHYPLDTWVLDEEVRKCQFRLTYSYDDAKWARPKDCHYNYKTMMRSGILGTEQSKAYMRMLMEAAKMNTQ